MWGVVGHTGSEQTRTAAADLLKVLGSNTGQVKGLGHAADAGEHQEERAGKAGLCHIARLQIKTELCVQVCFSAEHPLAPSIEEY